MNQKKCEGALFKLPLEVALLLKINKHFPVLVFILFQCFSAYANSENVKWTSEGIHVNSFVENKGQFDQRPVETNSKVLYVVDHGMEQIYFTETGIVYYFEEKIRNPDRPRGDKTMPKKVRIKESIGFEWENANPKPEVIAEKQTEDYFTYVFSSKGSSNTNFREVKARGYKKLTYKNLYPNIDLEYTFHPEGGIKYAVVLHPGADPSQFKMNYHSDQKISLGAEGKISIETAIGPIIEHQPQTFYADNEASEITSEFLKEDQSISFRLGQYDKSKTVIIDPWVQTPAHANSNCVWEVEKDAAGNAYIIGSDSPMKLQKYNTAGILQWTHNTPYNIDPDSMWLGSFATDQAGNSYVSNGSTAAIQKVNTNGSVVWNNPNPAFGAYEFWNIVFNCDQSKLVVGGTGVIGGTAGAIFNIDVNSGNVINSEIVTSGSFGVNPQEVRSISDAFNSHYYFISHDTVGAVHQSISNTPCISGGPVFKFKRDHGYSFSYKCENYRPSNGNAGIMAIRANENYVYTQNGETLHQRSLSDGSILNTVSIPGGSSVTVPIIGREQPENSGIAIDDCGNVYVGSTNAVLKYDNNLNLISTESTPYRVFDISIANNGEILVAGSTGDNTVSNRTGYVQSINMSACSPRSITCCDATICPQDKLCEFDAAITLTPFTPGGTWSGPGITNSTTGEFDPSTAGSGQHTIIYTLSCGSDSINISVSDCVMEVCAEQNGDLTAYDGTAPYTWEVQELDCSGCLFGNCDPFICPGVTVWTQYSTNATATPPGYPVRVLDSNGDIVQVNALIDVPTCADSCTGQLLSINNIFNPSCSDSGNGSFTLNTSGFTAPFQYTLSDQNGAVINNFSSSNNSEIFSGLDAQQYTVNITDDEGCTADTSITLNEPAPLQVSITDTTDATCSGNDGSATASASGGTSPYSYSWSPSGGNSATANNLSVGTYTVEVEDDNGCTASIAVLIESSNGPELAIDTVVNISCPGAEDGAIDVTISAGTPPYTFNWSSGATSQNISSLGPDNYSLTASDNNNCEAIVNASITEPDAIQLSENISGSGCEGTATITVNASGGTPGYTYEWGNGQTGNSISNLSSGNYSVTATDNNNCTASKTFTIDSTGSFNIDLNAVNASCGGVSNGAISSSINGGNAPFAYSWSNGENTADIQNQSSGVYSVTVFDNNNCSVTATDTIFNDENIIVRISFTNVVCAQDSNGAIKLTPLSGTPPFQAIWSNGATDISPSGLLTGTYSVTLTDSAGCELDTSLEITSASDFSFSVFATSHSCQNQNQGSLNTEITNGTTGPFEYNWSTGDTSANISGLNSGSYILTVTDSLNCTKTDTAEIYSTSLLIESEVINASCFDKADGNIYLKVSGGSKPYTFEWSNGATDSTINNLEAGVYTVTVTDAENCFLSRDFEVEVDESLSENCDSIVIYDVFSPNGDGVNDFWIIDGLEKYPDHELKIFNRWGANIYEASPYNNDWNGHSKNGEALPTATYYYIFRLNNGSDDVYSGHINLIR